MAIRSELDALEGDRALYEEANFRARAEALDLLESDLAAQMESLLVAEGPSPELEALQHRAARLKGQLGAVDERLFRRLRARIASGDDARTGLRQQWVDLAGQGLAQDEEGYDTLDTLVQGLLLVGAPPQETRQLEADMVAYQPTPARIILELVDRAGLGPDDLFVDVGSGLGQVSLLVHTLTGVRVKGTEVEPAYVTYARHCARELNLSPLEFVAVDARQADYSEGTVFFLYTPFLGEMLDQVLDRLRAEAKTRRIRLYTYGPCTPQVARQEWLATMGEQGQQVYRLAAFQSASPAFEGE